MKKYVIPTTKTDSVESSILCASGWASLPGPGGDGGEM